MTTPNTELMQPLESQIQRANELHDQAKSSFAQGCELMILCGLQLLELKAQVKHGEWEQLFDGAKRVKGKPAAGNAHSCGHFNFGRETARKYVDLGREAQQKISKLKSLGDKGFGEMSEEFRREAVAEIRAAIGPANYSQLAAEWGIIKRPNQVGGDVTPRDADGKRIKRSAEELAAEEIFFADEVVRCTAVRMLELYEERDHKTLCLAKPETRKILREAMIDLRRVLDGIKEEK